MNFQTIILQLGQGMLVTVEIFFRYRWDFWWLLEECQKMCC